MFNVWEMRPRVPTVRSMTSLPVAGLHYALGNKSKGHANSVSVTSSPPPEYDTADGLVVGASAAASATDAPASRAALDGPAPEDLERALVLQRMRDEAAGRARYVAQGALMLGASQEATAAARTPEDLAFARELYLSSLAYVLRGVPADLDAEERGALERALRQLRDRAGLELPASTSTGSAGGADEVDLARAQQLFCRLCRGTALVVRLSLPRIRSGLATAVALERQYRLVERSSAVVSASLLTVADRAARTSLPPTLPNLARLGGLADGLVTGLSMGLSEGYRVLTEPEA